MINQDPHHVHTYDAQGNMTCCTLEDKINRDAEEHDHAHGHDHDHSHDHGATESNLKLFLPAIVSIVLLGSAILIDIYFRLSFFTGWVRISWYILAYMLVGFPVLKDALKGIQNGEFFTEFLLMGLATIGAFAIGEYPEAVAVMLFYAVGEVFQTLAVRRAKSNIKDLLDQRPDEVTIVADRKIRKIKAETVAIGAVLELRPGEKLALDGTLLSNSSSFNTAALTGESKPDTKSKGETVLAGMINLNSVSQVRVTAAYKDSKLSRILELVQHATSQKAQTELFIRKFAKYYTPGVVVLALLIWLVPYFFVSDYIFSEWLYRSLIFLVISCPCALVISIPLGYFGGIGAASRNGILFKGGNFLDIMANVKQVVMDKTGTLTKGVFTVQEVKISSHEISKEELLRMVNALESKSTHPVATAIGEYAGDPDASVSLEEVEEIPGHGLKAKIRGKEILVGNAKLMDRYAVSYDSTLLETANTVIAIAYDRKFAGLITIADELKEDALITIRALHKLNVTTTMLSGDKKSVVKDVAEKLGIDHAFGDLLPEDKVNKVKEIKGAHGSVAFVGDGVNDAPVIALSDAGIAMGGLGSDAAIETADVVIQDDKPSKIPIAIAIGKQTKQIVWQNISMAFAVKAMVLLLGASGLATMWEAVFADVGVALLAILNAVRVQRMRF
ncbi:MAG TPA: heavy metal translocating P-type ATPase [Cyclobacteriaceae bacterium]|nr:heavy metal translocating P-type ATPase [Cyclobacteriaceae bacterium]